MTYCSKSHWWIVLIGLFLVVLFSLQIGSAARFEGQYIPVGHDSFYHGARIRDALKTGSVGQFDARIHAPTGDWITWPWAYDAALATVARFAHSTLNADPMVAVAHVPVALGITALMALFLVAVRLKLPVGLALVAMLSFGISGTTQYLYGVGVLDHHGAEQLSMLFALGFGIAWRQRPDAAIWPLLLGLCLSLALGVHASMVVLQLPLIATLLLDWRRGEVPARRGSGMFVGGLAAGLLLVISPAATAGQNRFDLYYLSWLQVYCTAVTAGVAVVLSRCGYSPRRAIVAALVMISLALPLYAALRFSVSFLAGDLSAIARIDETRSPIDVAMHPGGFARISRFYSLLIWLAPLTLLGSVAMVFRDADAGRRHFWIWATFGLALVLLQQRMVSIGAAFLFLAPLVLLAVWVADRPRAIGMAYLLAALVMVVAFAPTLRHQLLATRIPAMDEQFVTLQPLLPALVDSCRRQPGVVLATPGDGHIIRYFTDCGVVSNNFRLTPRDVERIVTTLDMIGRPASELPNRAPYVNFVLARLVEPAESQNPVLFSELLNPVGDVAEPGYRSIAEVGVIQPDGSRVDFLGLFAVTTQSPTSSPGT
jgi:hypothetical protein